jgi:hypothetical protein
MLMRSHLDLPAPMLIDYRPEVPAGLDAVVARSMAKRPEVPYARAGSFGVAARMALTPTVRTTVREVKPSSSHSVASRVPERWKPNSTASLPPSTSNISHQ